MGIILNKLAYLPPQPGYRDINGEVDWDSDVECAPGCIEHFQFLRTDSRRAIATLFVSNPEAQQTILYSHGNAEDLNMARRYMLEASEILRVNIICYDYAGYGLSEGSPCESNTFDDIETVYNHLIHDRNIFPKNIILLGRSLGSGPTCECALRHSQEIGGVIIQSGLLSAIRVVQENPGPLTLIDIYKNFEKVQRIKCPIYVIHGSDDLVIPCYHGKELAELCFRLWRCWIVDSAGHNDIEYLYYSTYFDNIAGFLSHVMLYKEKQVDATFSSSS